MTSEPMLVVYDGECPFCTDFVKLQELRKNVGKVELLDARSDDPRIRQFQEAGYDLNDGMIVDYGRVYYGSDAVALMSTLSGANGLRGRLLAALLKDKRRAAMLYPAMKFGRRIVLTMLGKKPIPSR